MSRKLLMGLALMVSVSAQSELAELEIGSDEQNKQSYLSETDARMIAKMNQDIDQKCDAHGCTYVSRTDHRKGWTISFNVGNGPVSNTNGTGTVINVNGNSNENQNANYYGVTVSYTNMSCTSDLKIDVDNFINMKARAIAQREDGTYQMKPLTSDMKFIELLNLEIYKQLGNSGCLR